MKSSYIELSYDQVALASALILINGAIWHCSGWAWAVGCCWRRSARWCSF